MSDTFELSGTGKEFGQRGQEFLNAAIHTNEYYALVINDTAIISSLMLSNVKAPEAPAEMAATWKLAGNALGAGQQLFAPKGKKITSVTIDSGSALGYLHKEI